MQPSYLSQNNWFQQSLNSLRHMNIFLQCLLQKIVFLSVHEIHYVALYCIVLFVTRNNDL